MLLHIIGCFVRTVWFPLHFLKEKKQRNFIIENCFAIFYGSFDETVSKVSGVVGEG